MKVENLEKASLLKGDLERIDLDIKAAKTATGVFITNDDIYTNVRVSELKYGQSKILKTIKPLFLSALQKERDYILKEIDKLD